MFVFEVKKSTRNPAKRDEMYREEIEDRAALLCRLGYSVKTAKSRLKANIKWDFELGGTSRHASDVDKIVDAVYRRKGSKRQLSL